MSAIRPKMNKERNEKSLKKLHLLQKSMIILDENLQGVANRIRVFSKTMDIENILQSWIKGNSFCIDLRKNLL